MATGRSDTLLLITTVYSFFICFIFNVFGYVLSYHQMTYEWKLLNIHEARKSVFNTAIFHLFLFGGCCFIYLYKANRRDKKFKRIKGSESIFDQNQLESHA